MLVGIAAVASAERSKNILFICIDDLRPKLGCCEDPVALTPNMDQLAKGGMLFRKAYCQFAICGPSRASVLSGMYPFRSGIQDNVKSFRDALPDRFSLPQYFREKGYHTVGMGKIFHSHQPDALSWDQWVKIDGSGADYFDPENIQAMRQRRAQVVAREKAGEKFKPWQRRELIIGPFSETAEVSDEKYPDWQLATHAMESLRNLKNSEKPFFVAVGFHKPHLPLVVPKKYWDLYNPRELLVPEELAFPEGAPAWHTHNSFELRGYQDVSKTGPIDEETVRRAVHGYYAACSFVDAQVGRVLDELKRLELDRNTIVVLWGDNGFHLGENGMLCKDTNFEAAAAVPLMLSAPGLAPATVDRPVELVGIFPTLCSLAGVPVPDQCDGENLCSPESGDDAVAFTMNQRKWNSPNVGCSVRADQYRYIRWTAPDGSVVAEELYDYSLGQEEKRNLAAEKEYRKTLKLLRKRLDAVLTD